MTKTSRRKKQLNDKAGLHTDGKTYIYGCTRRNHACLTRCSGGMEHETWQG